MATIGIVTIFDADNYGAELQAYALPEVLRAWGHEARLVDYPFYKSPRFRMTRRAWPVLPLTPGQWVREWGMAARTWLWRRLHPRVAARRAANFAHFRERIPRTRLYDTFDALLRDPPSCEVYLTGSDQVWNPRMGATLRPYFLDFLPEGARRLAYAASFGVPEVSAATAEQYHRWLARYEAVGCREPAGVALMGRLCPECPAVAVLDPTLLLGAEAWRRVARLPEGMAGKRYLLVYELVPAPALWAVARRWAARLGVGIVCLSGGAGGTRRAGVRTVADAGPEAFVALFAQAEAVVTTSFHGTVFSLLFRRPFISVVPAKMRNAGRQRGLLEQVGLLSRLVPEACLGTVNPEEPVDWALAEARLEGARAASFDFLRKALAGGFRHAH